MNGSKLILVVVLIAVVASTGGLAGEAHGQSPDWTASLSVPGFPSPFISEWERNPAALRLTLVYAGTNERSYRVEGFVRSSGGTEMARAVSPVQTVFGGPSTVTITGNDLFDWQLLPARRSDIDRALRTGVIPEGEYELCARVVSPADIRLAEACAFMTIVLPDRPELVAPSHGEQVTALQPTFQWTPVIVPPALGVRYRLRIVERLEGQTPDVSMRMNVAHHDVETAGAPHFVYPADALQFDAGREYVWQVEALDGMGDPLLPGGLRSEPRAFRVQATAGEPDVPDDGFADVIELVPGVAWIDGIDGLEIESTSFGYVLEGSAWVHLAEPTRTRARVRLQDLAVAVQGGALVPQSGRVVGRIPDGALDVPLSGAAGDLSLTRLDYTPEGGLRVAGELALPGVDGIALEGEAQLTATGLYGMLAAEVGPEAPLLSWTGGDIEIGATRAEVLLPEGLLRLEGHTIVLGREAGCGPNEILLSEDGTWLSTVFCDDPVQLPLAEDIAGASVQLGPLAGEVGGRIDGGIEHYELDGWGRLSLVSGSSDCRATADVRLGMDGLTAGPVNSRCDGSARVQLGWLELELSNLQLHELAVSNGTVELSAAVDAVPHIPAAPDLLLPTFAGITISNEGLIFPSLNVDEPFAPADLAGVRLHLSGLVVPGFSLGWTEWGGGVAGEARFEVEGSASLAGIGTEYPACLRSTHIGLSAAVLSADGFTADVDHSFSGAACSAQLFEHLTVGLDQISAALALSLDPTVSAPAELTVLGWVEPGAPFVCEGGESAAVAAEIVLSTDGSVAASLPDVAPACPIRFAGIELWLEEGTLDLARGPAIEPLASISASASGQFGAGGTPVSGSGTIEADLIEGRLVDASLAFDGPLRFDLPADEPVLSFSVPGVTVDTAGILIDGRGDLLLEGGVEIGTTFDEARIAFQPFGFSAGRILFDAPFALDVGLSDGSGLAWMAVDPESSFALNVGGRLSLPAGIELNPDGLSVDGSGEARLVYDGHDLADLSAAFTDGFSLGVHPTEVTAGRVDFQQNGIVLAHIDAAGFHPNLAYLGQGLLPTRLGLPSTAVAYLELKDGDDELRVLTESLAEGLRIHTPPGGTVPLVFPALTPVGGEPPSIEITFDVVIDPVEWEFVSGSLDVAVPPGTEAEFDLTPLGIPFAIASILYDEDAYGVYRLTLGGRLSPFGAPLGAQGSASLTLSGAGILSGIVEIDLPAESSFSLLPESDLLAYRFDRVEAAFDVSLLGGPSSWSIDHEGHLDVALGSGTPYSVATTLRASPTGVSVPTIDIDPDAEARFFDLAGVQLGVSHLRIPTLEFDATDGWDVGLLFDLTIAFDALGIELPEVPDVALDRDGLTIPEVSMPELSGAVFDLAGFRAEALAFRMDSVALNPFGQDGLPDDWGFSFDLEIGLSDSLDGLPEGLSGLALSVLDAGYSGGRFTGTIEPRFPDTPIELAVGEMGMSIDLTELGGSIADIGTGQEVTITGGGAWTLPEFMRCGMAADQVDLAGASFDIASTGSVSGVVTDLAPGCPIEIGPLEIDITTSTLDFAFAPAGGSASLALSGTANLPAPGGGTVASAGSITVDLLAPTITDGEILLTEEFRWDLPSDDPFLTLLVSEGRLDSSGLVLSGTGGLPLEGTTDVVGVQFNDLTISLPDFAITTGSADLSGGFALDMEIEAGTLSWAARPTGSDLPAGSGARIEVPETVELDAQGLSLAGTGTAAIRYADEEFVALSTHFTEGFRLGFSPVGVEDGRAGFEYQGTEIAFVDSDGFYPGDVFGVLPIPTRLPLGSEDIAYIQLRDPADTTVVLIQSGTVGDGDLEISTHEGQPVTLVIPALATGDGAPPSIDVEFSVVVNPSTYSFVSGAVTAGIDAGEPELFGLELAGLGVPLSVQAISYASSSPYSLTLDTSFDLPQALGGSTVVLSDLVVSTGGLSGEAKVGTFRDDYEEGEDAIVTHAFGNGIEIALNGVHARFTDQDRGIDLEGHVLTTLFEDESGDPTGIEFEAGYGATGFTFVAATDDLGVLPLGFATFTPVPLDDQPAISASIDGLELALVLSGVIEAPFLSEDFAVTVAGLEISTTEGFVFPTVSLALEEDFQVFELFGAGFTLMDSVMTASAPQTVFPAIAFDYDDGVLGLTMTGEVELPFTEQSPRFHGFRVATDGSVGMEGLSLISEPITIVDEILYLADLTIHSDAELTLRAGMDVHLPEPLDQNEAQHVFVDIGVSGSISGGGNIVLMETEDDADGLSLGIATVHLRYLGLSMDFSEGLGGSTVQLVSDIDLMGDDERRIHVGNRNGGTVAPGLQVGFDGSVLWQNVELATDTVVLGVEALNLRIGQLGINGDGTTFAFDFGGELSLDLAQVSGGLVFEEFGLSYDSGEGGIGVSLNPQGVMGGHLTIADLINLSLSSFAFSTEPETIEVPNVGLPTADSPELSNGTTTVDVSSYFRFTDASIGVGSGCGNGGSDCMFGADVGEVLFYRTLDGGTSFTVSEAALDIQDLVSASGDFLYQSPGGGSGFELMLAASADILNGQYGGMLAGVFDNTDPSVGLRAGLFVAVDADIPIAPPLMLSGLGGGFFYQARQAHLDLVQSLAQVDLPESVDNNIDPGRFTGMLYAAAVIANEEVAQGRILLTASETGARLMGNLEILSSAGALPGQSGPPITGFADVQVGFKQKFAQGNFGIDVDFDPIASGNGAVEFFVYGADAWGVLGEAELTYLKLVGGDASFFVGPPGFVVSGGLWASFDAWILEVSANMDASMWYYAPPQGETDWGAFMSVGVQASLLGGTITGSGTVQGALVSGPMVYAGALVEGCVKVVGCASRNITAKFEGGSPSVSFGSDPALDDILARARNAQNAMLSERDAMADAIEESRPAPEAVTVSDDALADAYQRMQEGAPWQARSAVLQARHLEQNYLIAPTVPPNQPGLKAQMEAYDAWLYDYITSYADVVAQEGAPRVLGLDPENQKYGVALAGTLNTIETVHPDVTSRLMQIQASLAELEQLAAEPWPESPLTGVTFDAPQTETQIDAQGDTVKVLLSGPGFDGEQTAANNATVTSDLESRREITDALLDDVRDRIAEMEDGIASLEGTLTSSVDPDSPLRYAALHQQATEHAERLYMEMGRGVLAYQDWLRGGLAWLNGTKPMLTIVLNQQRSRLPLRSGTYNIVNLAHTRASRLGNWLDDPSLQPQVSAVVNDFDTPDSVVRDQARDLGVQLFHDFARAGMEAADEQASAEFLWVRQEAATRLASMYEHHQRVTGDLHTLHHRRAELTGHLYDAYDRFSLWLDAYAQTAENGASDVSTEQAEVANRMAGLEAELGVPAITDFRVRVFGSRYSAREEFVLDPSHPSGTFESLVASYDVADPLMQISPTFTMYQLAGQGDDPADAPEPDDVEPDPVEIAPGFGALRSVGWTPTGSTIATRWVLRPDRETETVSRIAQAGARGGAGYVGLRQTEYATHFSEDGTSMVSHAMTDDTEPPSQPQVRFRRPSGTWSNASGTGVGTWFADVERINVRWEATDQQSGVAEYEYAVGTHGDTTSVRGWTSAGGRTETAVHGLEIAPDSVHYIYVRARNGAGLWSDTGRSAAFRFDPTPPIWEDDATLELTAVTPIPDEPDFQSLNSGAFAACPVTYPADIGASSSPYLPESEATPMRIRRTPEITVSLPQVDDPESGVDAYHWRLFEGEPEAFGDGEGWGEADAGAESLTIEGDPLDYQTPVHLAVVASNGAGLVGAPLVVEVVAPDTRAPSAPGFCAGQSMQHQRIHLGFSRGSVDRESGIAGYDYRVRTEDGQVVRDWPASPDWSTIDVQHSPYSGLTTGPLGGGEPSRGIARTTGALELTDGERYYVDVRALNRQGSYTIRTSGPIPVDFTAPERPQISTIDYLNVMGDQPHDGAFRVTVAGGAIMAQWGIVEGLLDENAMEGEQLRSVGWLARGYFDMARSQGDNGAAVMIADDPAAIHDIDPGGVYSLFVRTIGETGVPSRMGRTYFLWTAASGVITGQSEDELMANYEKWMEEAGS